MKRILYLTFYFRPDLCAGSFRNSPLVDELAAQAEAAEASIDVYTTHPQRYSSFTQSADDREEKGNISIERIAIPHHKSGFMDQVNGFRFFFREVSKRTRNKRYDMVFASSSRLFTAYLGYTIARRLGIPLFLDIRDIFVDTISEVVRNPAVKAAALPVLKFIENRTFGYASHINLISGGFKPYFAKYPKPRYTEFTNGIDDVFIKASRSDPPTTDKGGRKRIVYAGNIGDGQGLHKVVPQAARLLGDEWEFRIIGDGGAKKALVEKIRELGVGNVILRDPVNRGALIAEYLDSDYLFIHLNDYEAFKKVLPSKIFELGVFNKTLLAGVGGYARDFMALNLPGTLLFDPGDYRDLVRQLGLRREGVSASDRVGFIETFRRDRINARMAESILACLK